MDNKIPLAELIRPKKLSDFIGQEHLLRKNSVIYNMINTAKLSSLILWGPPGVGKTTLARLLVNEINKKNINTKTLSAVFSSVSELKKIFKEAEELKSRGVETVLFVDEIHRFNKAQQDAFLPVVESGIVKLIASTTENPSFRINSALLSRCNIITLNKLSKDDLLQILERAEILLESSLPLDNDARLYLVNMADGDARYLLNMAEQLFTIKNTTKLNLTQLKQTIEKRMYHYDTNADEHYNLISALHKSLRGSDPDASGYWLTRMLRAGEDPLYILRRLLRFATEDIGLADPTATQYAIATIETYKTLGSPEGELAILNLVIYLALAPKSNSTYIALKDLNTFVKETGSPAPPKHILNAPTRLMKELDYGKDYIYDHDLENAFSGQNYFPDNIQRQRFYHPVERGFEREMLKRIRYFNKLRKNKKN